MEDDETELSLDASYAFMCGKCLHVYPSIKEIETHDCIPVPEQNQQKANVTPGSVIKALAPSSISESGGNISENYVTAEVVELDSRTDGIITSGEAFDSNSKQNIDYIIEGIEEIEKSTKREYRDEYDPMEDEEERQRKKRKTYNNDYLLNKLIRDPYFKLDRNSYTFKDTLGDWDERSTKLLIILVGKYPKCHFLLQYYFERRLSHWENIHHCMLNTAYNFTVLQLRMRWREIFAKYRWTMNHNDLHQEKKTFEYMKEMDELFGIWTTDATEALINLVEVSHNDNPSTKHKRLGYMGWERIASAMQGQRYRYGTLQVEARWHMLVTTYKSVLDHNIMPTVEPIEAAFSDRLKHLINYEPRRRKDYEKYKGKKVKLEKFPEIAMKHLIKIYENNIPRFLDGKMKTSEIWEDMKSALDSTGFIYAVSKIKEIFFATLKLYERCLQHNAIPGAIKREGPHYKELSEIFDLYGFWPHVKRRKKTQDEKIMKKYTVRLRESMQMWYTEESRSLLKLYPTLLENFVSQTASSAQPNDLWAQVAQAYEKLGFSKRDIPDIATHMGLLRQGYAQGNNFPFNEEMQKLMEVEEALCYSPDVSKFTGDAEIVYWSHDSVFLLLDIYLKVQPILPYSSLSNEVFSRLVKEMRKFGYNFTFEDIRDEIRSLLYQFTMRKCKPEKSSSENWGKHKSIFMYKDKMMEVMELREKLSVGFTNGLKPISNDVMDVVYNVAKEKCESLFSTPLNEDEQIERLKLVILTVRREVRKIIKRKPPAARKICVHLLTALSSFAENPNPGPDITGLYHILGHLDYEKILSEVMKDTHNGSFKLSKDLLKLEKKFVSVESVDIHSETDYPECILNVHDIDDLDSYEDHYITSDQFPKNEIGVASITLDEELGPDPEQSNHNQCGKLIYIDNESGTKTTVLSQKDTTCISVDNIKAEPEDEEEELLSFNAFDFQSELKVEYNDGSKDQELDGLAGSKDQEDSDEETECQRDGTVSSFLNNFEKKLKQVRQEEREVLELLKEQKRTERLMMQAIFQQIREIIE